jgi:hypothetical protein
VTRDACSSLSVTARSLVTGCLSANGGHRWLLRRFCDELVLAEAAAECTQQRSLTGSQSEHFVWQRYHVYLLSRSQHRPRPLMVHLCREVVQFAVMESARASLPLSARDRFVQRLGRRPLIRQRQPRDCGNTIPAVVLSSAFVIRLHAVSRFGCISSERAMSTVVSPRQVKVCPAFLAQATIVEDLLGRKLDRW